MKSKDIRNCLLSIAAIAFSASFWLIWYFNVGGVWTISVSSEDSFRYEQYIFIAAICTLFLAAITSLAAVGVTVLCLYGVKFSIHSKSENEYTVPLKKRA